MNNAEKFKQVFGLYATELWSMPESDFLEWLNRDVETTQIDHNADISKKAEGDCISRKAAIDAPKGLPTWWADEGGYYGGAQPPMVALLDPEDAVSAIENLPSAQPEKQHGRIFQEIVVKYYPSYNPYPERKGKPYFSIKYTENGQEFIGYGTYKPEVLSEYLKEDFMPSAQPEQRWIPCSERLPEEGQKCLVYDKAIGFRVDTYIGHGNPYNWELFVRDYEAWMPLPELYRGGDE